MVKGDDLIIYTGVPAVAIAAATSCQIARDSEVEEISSPSSARAKTYVPGRTSWEVSVSTLVLSGNVTPHILKAGQEYMLSWKERQETFYTAYCGNSICIHADIVASKNTLAQGSLRFIGNGDIMPWDPIGDFDHDYNEDYLNDPIEEEEETEEENNENE